MTPSTPDTPKAQTPNAQGDALRDDDTITVRLDADTAAILKQAADDSFVTVDQAASVLTALYLRRVQHQADALASSPAPVGEADTARLDWLEVNGVDDITSLGAFSQDGSERWYDHHDRAPIGADRFPTLRALIDAAMSSRPEGQGGAS